MIFVEEERIALEEDCPRFGGVDVCGRNHRRPARSIATDDLRNVSRLHSGLREGTPQREVLPSVQAIIRREAADLLQCGPSYQRHRVDVIPIAQPFRYPWEPTHQVEGAGRIELLEDAVRERRSRVSVQCVSQTPK